jgi:hypothetical protein
MSCIGQAVKTEKLRISSMFFLSAYSNEINIALQICCFSSLFNILDISVVHSAINVSHQLNHNYVRDI